MEPQWVRVLGCRLVREASESWARQLWVTLSEGLGREVVYVKDLAEASRVVTEWQDARGLGAGDVGDGHGDVRRGDDLVARVSYNGRVREVTG